MGVRDHGLEAPESRQLLTRAGGGVPTKGSKGVKEFMTSLVVGCFEGLMFWRKIFGEMLLFLREMSRILATTKLTNGHQPIQVPRRSRWQRRNG